jgi:hypothetical protein
MEMWNVLYPAMNDANLVNDCLPEPPTPTRRTLPPGCRNVREIFEMKVQVEPGRTLSFQNFSYFNEMLNGVLEKDEIHAVAADHFIVLDQEHVESFLEVIQ